MEKVKNKRRRSHPHHFSNLGIYVFESRYSADFSMAIGEWDFHKLRMT